MQPSRGSINAQFIGCRYRDPVERVRARPARRNRPADDPARHHRRSWTSKNGSRRRRRRRDAGRAWNDADGSRGDRSRPGARIQAGGLGGLGPAVSSSGTCSRAHPRGDRRRTGSGAHRKRHRHRRSARLAVPRASSGHVSDRSPRLVDLGSGDGAFVTAASSTRGLSELDIMGVGVAPFRLVGSGLASASTPVRSRPGGGRESSDVGGGQVDAADALNGFQPAAPGTCSRGR